MTNIQKIHKIVTGVFSKDRTHMHPNDHEIASAYEILSLAGVYHPKIIEIPVHWSGFLVIRFALPEYSDCIIFCLSCYTNQEGFNIHLLLDALNLFPPKADTEYAGLTLMHLKNKISIKGGTHG